MYLNGCVSFSVTTSHQELSPSDKMTLAPPDRKNTHTLSRTVRKDENRVLGRNRERERDGHQTHRELRLKADVGANARLIYNISCSYLEHPLFLLLQLSQ